MNSDVEELRDFYHFLGRKLANGVPPLGPEAALQEWRLEHPDPHVDEDLAAIQGALDDKAAGDKGRPLDDVIGELSAGSGHFSGLKRSARITAPLTGTTT